MTLDQRAYEHVAELATRINVQSWAKRLRRGDPAIAVLQGIQRSVDHYMDKKRQLMHHG